jgi:hypothetical protein
LRHWPSSSSQWWPHPAQCQESGEIRRRGDGGGIPTPGVRGSASRRSSECVLDYKGSPTDYASKSALSNNEAGIYNLADDVTDAQFDAAAGGAGGGCGTVTAQRCATGTLWPIGHRVRLLVAGVASGDTSEGSLQ